MYTNDCQQHRAYNACGETKKSSANKNQKPHSRRKFVANKAFEKHKSSTSHYKHLHILCKSTKNIIL